MISYPIRTLDIFHYEEIVSLWVRCGLTYRPYGRDSREAMKQVLASTVRTTAYKSNQVTLSARESKELLSITEGGQLVALQVEAKGVDPDYPWLFIVLDGNIVYHYSLPFNKLYSWYNGDNVKVRICEWDTTNDVYVIEIRDPLKWTSSLKVRIQNTHGSGASMTATGDILYEKAGV